MCHYYTTTGPPCHCQQCKEDYRQDRREIIEEFKEKRRIAIRVLANRETEEALSDAEAEAEAANTAEMSNPTKQVYLDPVSSSPLQRPMRTHQKSINPIGNYIQDCSSDITQS